MGEIVIFDLSAQLNPAEQRIIFSTLFISCICSARFFHSGGKWMRLQEGNWGMTLNETKLNDFISLGGGGYHWSKKSHLSSFSTKINSF
jgi:hypothetical protein